MKMNQSYHLGIAPVAYTVYKMNIIKRLFLGSGQMKQIKCDKTDRNMFHSAD